MVLLIRLFSTYRNFPSWWPDSNMTMSAVSRSIEPWNHGWSRWSSRAIICTNFCRCAPRTFSSWEPFNTHTATVALTSLTWFCGPLVWTAAISKCQQWPITSHVLVISCHWYFGQRPTDVLLGDSISPFFLANIRLSVLPKHRETCN